MDILTASPVSQGVTSTPDVQPVAQTRPLQAPEAPAAGRQPETVASVDVQISDAARAVAARDQTGSPRSATGDGSAQQAGNDNASMPRAEGRTAQEAVRMFMDNAGDGMAAAKADASPLRTSA